MYRVKWLANRPNTNAEFYYFAETMAEYNEVAQEARTLLGELIKSHSLVRTPDGLGAELTIDFIDIDAWKKYVNYLLSQKRDLLMARNTYFEANNHTLRMIISVDGVIESDRIIDTSIETSSTHNTYGEPKVE